MNRFVDLNGKLEIGRSLSMWLKPLMIAVIGVLVAVPNASAQITATVNGTVTDSTGAVVPGAKITLTNDTTREVRDAVSNASGFFAYPALIPGSYSLRISAVGFTGIERDAINVNAGDLRNISGLALAVGSATDTVTVSQESQIIPVETGQRAAILNAKDIEQLALEGRNVDELLKVLPGVTSVAQGLKNGAGFNPLDTGAASSPVGQNELNANGAANRGGTTQFEDGVDIDDPGCDCNSIATLNPDMIQEVSVQTSNFGADAPRGPVVINATSKSGGADYHGNGYFYARNDALNANDWLDNHNGIPRGVAHYYYPGGNAGGPIPFTHKHLRIWGGYERFLQNSGNASELTSFIPTADMMAGNFTNTAANIAFCQGNLNATNTNGCNDLTGTILPDGSIVGQGNRPAGMIPSQFISPAALALAKIWPAANANPATTPGGFNYVQAEPGTHDGWIYRLRADYDLGQNNSLFVSYQQGFDTQIAPGGGAHVFWTPGNSIPFPGGPLQQVSHTKAISGHFTHIFGPTLTNEFIAAWGYGYFPDGLAPNISAAYRSTLNYPNYGTVFGGGSKLIPSYASAGTLTFPDFSEGDIFEGGGVYFFRKQTPSFSDNLTKVIKTHTIEVGVYTANIDNYGSAYGSLNGSINSFSGQANNALTGQLTGSNNPTANFLIGNVTSYSENNIQPPNDMAYQVFSFFANDVWKATPRLTVELGLRFDHIGHWYDRQKFGIPVWLPGDVAADAAGGRLDPGLRWQAIDPGVPSSGSPDKLLWTEPRFGLAYDVFGTGKTIVRGGWGEYRIAISNNNQVNPNATAQSQLSYNLPGQTSVLLSQIGQLKPSSPAPGSINGTVYALPYGDNSIPKTDSYNLTISEQLPRKMLFEIAYVGNKGERLNSPGADNLNSGYSDYINQNKVPLGAFFRPDPVTGVTSPDPENLGGPGSPNNKEADYHPYASAYGNSSIYVQQTNGYSSYNSLQAELLKRSDRLTFNLNYTWSKVLGTALAVDPFNIRRDYGVLSYDRPQVINTSYSYNVGKVYNGEKILQGAVNGWTISGITTWQEGANLQAINSPNFGLSLAYATNNGQSLTNNPLPAGVSKNLGPATYYGTSANISIQPVLTCNPGAGLANNQKAKVGCFTPPAIGQTGPAQYPYLHGAAFFDSDLALFKSFHTTEHQAVQFRISAFNWLNHPLPQFSGSSQLTLHYNADYATKQFALNTAQTSPTFGYLDSKSQAPTQRILELSVKYSF